MRHVHLTVAAVVTSLVGLHCAAPTVETVTEEPTNTQAPEQVSLPTPPEPRDTTPAGDRRDSVYGLREGITVTSTLRTDDGTFYTAGTFTGIVRINGTTLSSKGETDVFVEKTHADGTLAWVKSVGSEAADTSPKVKSVSADGVITLLGMTEGRLDCGGGPLPQFAAETFFMCLFDQEEGATVGGGTFPTGMH